MLIDSARSWNVAPTPEEVAIYGHGTVPIKIDDIIKMVYNGTLKFDVNLRE